MKMKWLIVTYCTFNLNQGQQVLIHHYAAFILTNMLTIHIRSNSCCSHEKQQKNDKDYFGEDMVRIQWQRPGFDLGLKLEKIARVNPKLKEFILDQHGLFMGRNIKRML